MIDKKYYSKHTCFKGNEYNVFYVYFKKQSQDALTALKAIDKAYKNFDLIGLLKTHFSGDGSTTKWADKRSRLQREVVDNEMLISHNRYTSSKVQRTTPNNPKCLLPSNLMDTYGLCEDVARLVQLKVLQLSNLNVFKRHQQSQLIDSRKDIAERFTQKLDPLYRDILNKQNDGVGEMVYPSFKLDDQKSFGTLNNVTRQLTLDYHEAEITITLPKNWMSEVVKKGIGVVEKKVVVEAKELKVIDDCRLYKAKWLRKTQEIKGRYMERWWQEEDGYIGIVGEPDKPLAVRSSKSLGHIMEMTKRSGVKNVLGNIFDD